MKVWREQTGNGCHRIARIGPASAPDPDITRKAKGVQAKGVRPFSSRHREHESGPWVTHALTVRVAS